MSRASALSPRRRTQGVAPGPCGHTPSPKCDRRPAVSHFLPTTGTSEERSSRVSQRRNQRAELLHRCPEPLRATTSTAVWPSPPQPLSRWRTTCPHSMTCSSATRSAPRCSPACPSSPPGGCEPPARQLPLRRLRERVGQARDRAARPGASRREGRRYGLVRRRDGADGAYRSQADAPLIIALLERDELPF
jgi:hypothetical protein